MQLSAGILKLAEIAGKNGGKIPAELAQMIANEDNKTTVQGTEETTQRFVKEIIREALWT